MIIRDLTKEMYMEFGRLEVSSVFRWDERYFMKLSDHYEDYDYNTFDFSKNRLTKFDKAGEVEYCPSELVIHGKNLRKEDLYAWYIEK